MIWSIHNYFNTDIIDWLVSKTHIAKTELNEHIDELNESNKNREKKQTQIQLGLFNYDYFTALLYDTFNNKTYSSSYELKYNNQYGVDNIKFQTIKQDEISTKINEFLKSNQKIFVGKMLWGTGKTHYGLKTALSYAVENKIRTLIITENNALNTAYYNQIKELGYNVGYHQKKEKADIIETYDIWITSLQSLILTTQPIKDFPLIIGDEIESILSNFQSSKTYEKSYSITDTIIYLKQILTTASKIICLDCDISKKTIDLLRTHISEVIQLYNCDFNNWSDYKYNFYIEKSIFNDNMINDIKIGKKIVYCTLSKTNSIDIFNKLHRLQLNKNIILITGDRHTNLIINGDLYTGNTEYELKNKQEQLQRKIDNESTDTDTDYQYVEELNAELVIINKKLEIVKYVIY